MDRCGYEYCSSPFFNFILFNQKQTYLLKRIRSTRMKNPSKIYRLIKYKGGETFSNIHQKGIVIGNTKKSGSTFLRGLYNYKKVLKHCFSLC